MIVVFGVSAAIASPAMAAPRELSGGSMAMYLPQGVTPIASAASQSPRPSDALVGAADGNGSSGTLVSRVGAIGGMSSAQARLLALEAARQDAARERARLEAKAALHASQLGEYEDIHARTLRRISAGIAKKKE